MEVLTPALRIVTLGSQKTQHALGEYKLLVLWHVHLEFDW